MVTMRAVDIHGGAGAADALFLNEHIPKPTPRTGEALVRVKAFGLNRMDLLQREGHYPVPPGASPILGVEFSGEIAALGAADRGGNSDGGGRPFAVGDAVFGLVYGGAYAEYVAAPLRMLLHKPPALSWVEAAALPETWMTALQALHEVGGFPASPPPSGGGPPDPDGNQGRTVLWHAGASGVSIAGIQLARLAGAHAVYATAGSDAKCAFVVGELGATAAFNYKTGTTVEDKTGGGSVTTTPAPTPTKPDWAASLAAVAPAGVDLIIDYVGASYFQQNLTAAARDGRIVLLALLGGARLPADADVDISLILRKRLRIEGSSLRSRSPAYQARLRDRLAAVLPHFEQVAGAGTGAGADAAADPGRLRLYVDRVFPWAEIRAAHEYMESSVSMGKIICTIP